MWLCSFTMFESRRKWPPGWVPKYGVGDKVYVLPGEPSYYRDRLGVIDRVCRPNPPHPIHYGVLFDSDFFPILPDGTHRPIIERGKCGRGFDEVDLSPADEGVLLRMRLDPRYVTTREFWKYASPELRSKHLEIGGDFGFFNAGRVTESALVPPRRDYRSGDKVVVVMSDGCHHLCKVLDVIGFGPYYSVKSVQNLEFPERSDFISDGVHPDNFIEPEDYARRRVEEDPSFVTTEFFRTYAPRDLKDQYPEAGVDFGFFDARKVTESAKVKYHCGDKVVASVNGRRYFGTILEQVDPHTWRFGTAVCIDNPKDTRWRVYGVGDREIIEKITLRDYIRRAVRQDPGFVTTEFFRKYASPELKAEYPEAGVDFGFFDTKRINESQIPKFRRTITGKEVHEGDWLVLVENPRSNDLPLLPNNRLPEGMVGMDFQVTRIGKGYTDLRYFYPTVGIMTLRDLSNRFMRADDYAKGMVEDDPSFAANPIFARYASPELKAKYPEAGTDFGFFDTKRTNEEIRWPWRKRVPAPVPPVGATQCRPELNDWVVIPLSRGEDPALYFMKVGVVINTKDEGCWIYVQKYILKNGTVIEPPSYLTTGPGRSDTVFKRWGDVVGLREWIKKKMSEDPMFVTSEIFRECAPQSLRDEHPETGGDFGFFDAWRTNEHLIPGRKFHHGDNVFVLRYYPGFGHVHARKVADPGDQDDTMYYYIKMHTGDNAGNWCWYGEKDTDRAEDYVRRKVEEDPSYAATPEFRKYASPELKREYPEAGADFGFFDVKTNETRSAEKAAELRKWFLEHHSTPEENQYIDQIIQRMEKKFELNGFLFDRQNGQILDSTLPGKGEAGGDTYLVLYLRYEDEDAAFFIQEYNSKVHKSTQYRNTQVRLHHPRFCDLMNLSFEDPRFLKSEVLELLPREYKKEYRRRFPEAGTDFGFFDSKKRE